MLLAGWSRQLQPWLSRFTVAVALVLAGSVRPAGAFESRLPPAGAEQISYLTEDYPPSNYLENGQLKGVAVDLMKALWKQMGVAEQPIEVINWARGYQRALAAPNTVLFAMTRNAEREHQFQWVGPINHGLYCLYGLASRKLRLASVKDADAHRVGVLREDAGYKFLIEGGVAEARMEKVAHVLQLIQMLDAGHVDLICLPADSMNSFLVQQKGDRKRFATVMVVHRSALYYAFSKETPPKLVRRFQEALDKLEGERKRIVKRYGGTP